MQLRGAHAHRLPAWPTVSCAIWEAGAAGPSLRTEGAARRRSNDSAMKPSTRQMLGCGPDACLAEVCLNAGRIPAGKREYQHGEGLDGEKSAFMLSEFPSYPSPS